MLHSKKIVIYIIVLSLNLSILDAIMDIYDVQEDAENFVEKDTDDNDKLSEKETANNELSEKGVVPNDTPVTLWDIATRTVRNNLGSVTLDSNNYIKALVNQSEY